MPGYQPPPSLRQPVRSQRQAGSARLLIVAAAAALAGFLGWPYLNRGMLGNHAGFGPIWGMRLDPSESDTIEDRRGGDLSQLGPRSPRWGERQDSGPFGPWERAQSGNEGPVTSGSGRPRYRDARTAPDMRRVRRWRDCQLTRGGMNCGPWHTGPAPGEE
jgi:hypothetical protein